MIRKADDIFVLETKKTSYIFKVAETGQLEHLHYGKRIRIDDAAQAECLYKKNAFASGNTVIYDKTNPQYSLEEGEFEFGTTGKGDMREPLLEIIYPDGSRTSDFVYETYEIREGKKAFKTMPGSYVEGDSSKERVAFGGAVSTLSVFLKDRNSDVRLALKYFVFPECDVISRQTILKNESDTPIRLERLLSMSLDLKGVGYKVTSFSGAWTREMDRTDTVLNSGKYVVESRCGVSSNRANPFFMVTENEAVENAGEVFGFNLIYSGNHFEAVQVGAFFTTRVVSGINPEGFSWTLNPGEEFESPEAVMTFSAYGYRGMSKNMHAFVREHIVRGEWKKRPRPVLINNWEATYFDLNEKKLLALAKSAKEIGVELFVMDDGWFGERNDDTASLGDWTVNLKKLPDGVSGLCRKINALGMDFGIWVEPEMVSEKSELYRQHPEWAVRIPGKSHSEGRNQMFLDLSNPEVCDYIVDAMSEVFSSANIKYVKWDMNRIFSDVYSPGLSADRQGEMLHRYYIGLYSVLERLNEKFPEILFEGCASGGNRFDLGMLCYFPQFWISDNTDAISRAVIQKNVSLGYPQSVMSAHVSAVPNHQTLRVTPIETRFNVAALGLLGYEINLCDLRKEELEKIKKQIALYREIRDTVFFGRMYRGAAKDVFCGAASFYAGDENVELFAIVSKDRKKAVAVVLQKLVRPNSKELIIRIPGLIPDTLYRVVNVEGKHSIMDFGDLVNQESPIHIKQGSFVQRTVAKFVKLDGEREEYTAYGSTLSGAGITLKPAFVGTGFSDQVRHFPDFASRMYLIEEV